MSPRGVYISPRPQYPRLHLAGGRQEEMPVVLCSSSIACFVQERESITTQDNDTITLSPHCEKQTKAAMMGQRRGSSSAVGSGRTHRGPREHHIPTHPEAACGSLCPQPACQHQRGCFAAWERLGCPSAHTHCALSNPISPTHRTPSSVPGPETSEVSAVSVL